MTTKKKQKSVSISFNKCKLLNLPFRELVNRVSPKIQNWVLQSLSFDSRYNDACPSAISVDFIGTTSEDRFEHDSFTCKKDEDWDMLTFESTIEVRGKIYFYRKDKKDLNFKTYFGNINGSDEIIPEMYKVYVGETDDDDSMIELTFSED